MGKYAENVINKAEEKRSKKYTDEEKDAIRNYFNSYEEEEEMFCPNCKEKLIVGDWFTYEDVCGESNSPKYSCPNKECDCNKYNSFWNSHGEFFSGEMTCSLTSVLFPNDKYAALNSISKKSEVEIYGRGLKHKIWMHPALCFWILKPYIEFKYRSDKMGNVLGRTWKLKFLKLDKSRKTYSILYISGLHMLYFTLKEFKRKRKQYYNSKTKYTTNEILNQFEKRNWDKRWWHLLSRWYFNNFYKKLKKNILNMKRIYDIVNYDDIKFVVNELGLKIETVINYLETSNNETIKNYKVSIQKLRENKEKIYQTRKKLNL